MSDKILVLMPKLMQEIGAIPRGHRNKEFRYLYRSIDDIQNALQPVICKLGMSMFVRARELHTERFTEPKPRGGGERQIFHSTLLLDVGFCAPDGSSLLFTGAGEGLDYAGDKATNKAMVAAYKYAVTLGLSIPVEDLDDGDRDQLAGQPSVEPPKQAAAAEPQKTEPGKTSPKPRQLGTTDPYSVGPNDPCLEAEQEEIKLLAKGLGIDAFGLKAIVQKRGVQMLAQLTSVQAEEIIGRLKQKQLEAEAAKVF